MNTTLLDHIEDLEEYVKSLDIEGKKKVFKYLKAVDEYKRYNALEFMNLEEWQKKAITKSSSEDIMMVSAGNRLGKTYFSTYTAAVHATGKYPSDWTGKKFTRNINIMVMGYDWSQINRPKCTAELLLGPPDARGTGWIPKNDIVKLVPKIGMQNTVSTAWVKHYDEFGNYDGDTRLTFDVYSAGAGTLMGTEIDFALLDEQCPELIFSQVKKRLWSSRGSLLYVCTPEAG